MWNSPSPHRTTCTRQRDQDCSADRKSEESTIARSCVWSHNSFAPCDSCARAAMSDVVCSSRSSAHRRFPIAHTYGMPLKDSFPPVPPPLPRRIPVHVESTMPSMDVPSTRLPIPCTSPLLPPPLPTSTSRPMPSLLGFDAPLFHCHCSPKCIEFVKPRDHPDLTWIGSALQPLRTRVVAAGPTGGRHTKSKTADFDVDSRVAYEFNDVGFYEEMLSALHHNYTALLHTNARSQAFLHRMREKCPAVDLTAPRAYKPYYPTHHASTSFVAHRPLKDARTMAAQVVAPTIVASSGVAVDQRRSVEQIEAELREQAEAVAAASSAGTHIPAHVRDLHAPRVPVSQLSFNAANADPSGARVRLASERAQFAADMKERMLGKMSIAAVAQ
jgi:hypothetical protein